MQIMCLGTVTQPRQVLEIDFLGAYNAGDSLGFSRKLRSLINKLKKKKSVTLRLLVTFTFDILPS